METAGKNIRTWVNKQVKNVVKSFFNGISVFEKNTTYANKEDFLPFFESEPDYPNKVISIYENSATLSRCVTTSAKFIFGNGFQNKAFAETKLNNLGETADDLLRKATIEKALFGGVAFQVTYKIGASGAYEKDEISIIPFQRVLKSKQWVEGGVPYFGVRNVGLNKQVTYKKYVPYTSDLAEIFQGVQNAIIEAQAKSEKTGQNEKIDYKQLYYVFDSKPGSNIYPKCPAHSVIVDCENETSIKKSIRRDIQHGFSPSIIITKYGSQEAPTQEELDEDDIFNESLVGEDGSKVVVQHVFNKDNKPDIDAIPNLNLAQNYEYAQKSSTQAIERLYQIPTVLFGYEQSGKLGLEILQARDYMENVVVNADKLMLQKAFFDLCSDLPRCKAVNASNNFAIERFIFEEEKAKLATTTTTDATTNI